MSKWQGGRIPFGDGGAVGGWPRYSGDHPGNDTVPAWLSPGEVVIRRSSVNSDTAQILDYINKTGQNPGFYNGGSVAGTVTEQPNRGYFGWDDFANIITGGVYGALSGNWGGMEEWALWLTPAVYSTYKARYSENIWDLIDTTFDPITGPGLTKLLNLAGGEVNKVLPIVGDLIEAIAPTVGAIVGGVYGGPGGAAGGAAAGSGFASKWNNETNAEAVKKAAITAAITYVASAAGQYVSEAGGGKIGGAVANKAVGYAAKYVINEALGSTLAEDQVQSGQMTVSYAGSNAASILGGLSERMNALATKDYTVSAKNGLDYVPYDGMIVKTHRGEAVITAEENEERLSGAKSGKGGDVHLHFNVAGDLLDKDGFARTMIPVIKKAIKAGAH
jgi:hypothetical protein